MRLSEVEKKQIERAARNSKSVAAFLLSSAQKVTKYRQVIEQAEALQKLAGARNEKPSRLKVIAI